MRSPELKIEAITPVAGNVPLDLTLRTPCAWLKSPAAPIFGGCGRPCPAHAPPGNRTYAHGENGLGGAVFSEPTTKPVATPAAEMIRQIVRKYPAR